ncbi:pPIWI_RE module domain-containing protein [Actinoallomurus acaciae]|uniref:PPIWI_RE module domain-containing protein n=1 Tax=Actinoallomurus acaciae TaxID=502577 RepID=A0ABV5Y8W7_9ACTN
MAYNTIELGAFSVRTDAEAHFYILCLPPRLREALTEFYRSGLPERRRSEFHSFPIRSLNALLPLAAPDVLTTGSRVAAADDVPWLYSQHPVDVTLIRDLIGIWLRGLSGDEALKECALAELNSSRLRWEYEPVDLTRRELGGGGTALPEHRLYRLLPDLCGRLIRTRDEPFVGGGGRPWSFLETQTGGQGAELVSWPPCVEPDGAFSYLITITLHGIPFSPVPRLHVRTGVRRWVTEVDKGGTIFTRGRAASVYLVSESPWPGTNADTRRMARHRIRYSSATAKYGWLPVDRIDLLPTASLIENEIDAALLSEQPEAFLLGLNDLRVRAAIAYSNVMGKHEVGAGLMSADRAPMLRWVGEALSEVVERVPVCTRSRSSKPANLPVAARVPKRTEKLEAAAIRAAHARRSADDDAARRRRMLGEMLGEQPFVARICHQEQKTLDSAVDSFRSLLGLAPCEPVNGVWRWRCEEIAIVLQATRAGDLVRALEVGAVHLESGEFRAALRRRRKETAHAALVGGRKPDIVLVEIERTFKVRWSDPKFAVRLGFADAGVVSQFVQTPASKSLEKNMSHRVEKSWLDSFRQFGLARVPEHTASGVPEDLQYLAVWMAKRQRHGPTRRSVQKPVAVRLRPGGGAAAVEGWNSDARRWVPYRKFLLWLATGVSEEMVEDHLEEIGVVQDEADLDSARAIRRRETTAFLRSMLYNLRNTPTLLLSHAQNMRDSWTWLNHEALALDKIWLDDGDAVPIDLWGCGLRHVRVRDSARDETPQWHGSGEQEGIPAGVWRVGGDPSGRVFYSSSDRPHTAKNATVTARKEGTRVNQKEKVVRDTGVTAFNPNLLEIVVAACQAGAKPDQPQEWADCVHQLRFAPDLDAPLKIPYPLHMAKLAVEYVLPADDAD